MEDRAYKNATKRRRELQAEIDEIDQFLEQWKRYAGTEPGQTSTVRIAGEPDAALSVSPLLKQLITRENRAQVLREVLVEAGCPLTRGQIVAALIVRGLGVGGTDESKNIGTIMWRLGDQFVNIKGHGYWPRDLPYAKAGYRPESDEDNGQKEGGAPQGLDFSVN